MTGASGILDHAPLHLSDDLFTLRPSGQPCSSDIGL